MNDKETLKSDYFKKVYDANEDPWDFETSDYEAAKYDATIKSLPEKNYKNALEIGCSIGVLTFKLAEHCNKLLATDVSEIALDKAKKRCKDLKNVTFKMSDFAEDLPHDHFDLIMISEVAYYLSAEDWRTAINKLYSKLNLNGNIVLVHWLPEVHDYPQTGDEVHQIFAEFARNKMTHKTSKREENYRIDVWEKSGLK